MSNKADSSGEQHLRFGLHTCMHGYTSIHVRMHTHLHRQRKTQILSLDSSKLFLETVRANTEARTISPALAPVSYQHLSSPHNCTEETQPACYLDTVVAKPKSQVAQVSPESCHHLRRTYLGLCCGFLSLQVKPHIFLFLQKCVASFPLETFDFQMTLVNNMAVLPKPVVLNFPNVAAL